MDQKTVDIGGQRIAYRESNGAGRPVVLVHGNSASGRTWQAVLDGPFGQRRRCLALDLPGHGGSAAAADPTVYSLPGYASVLAGFAQALALSDAVFVGWSLGGHVVLEAAGQLPAAGLVIFGTPPVPDASAMAEAFLPNPAMAVGFSAALTEEQARAYAASFVAPGSPQPLAAFVADIVATDGAARENLYLSIGAGRFANEAEVVAGLRIPIAVFQGSGEQLVSLPYLLSVRMPTLWRGEVQLIAGAGHAPQEEAPEAFADLLGRFLADLD